MAVSGPIDPGAVGLGGAPEGGTAGEHSRSLGRAILETFVENRLAIVGLTVIVLMMTVESVGRRSHVPALAETPFSATAIRESTHLDRAFIATPL